MTSVRKAPHRATQPSLRVVDIDDEDLALVADLHAALFKGLADRRGVAFNNDVLANELGAPVSQRQWHAPVPESLNVLFGTGTKVQE